jgi:hypothetical protein
MELTDNKFRPAKRIPLFTIGVLDLLEVLENCPVDPESVEIVVDSTASSKQILLQGLADVKEHRHLLEVPFTIKISTLKLYVEYGPPTLHFDAKTENLAKSLERGLSEYRSWQNFLQYSFMPSVLGAAIAVLAYILVYEIWANEPLAAGAAFISFLVSAGAISYYSIYLVRSQVFLNKRGTYLRRNMDTLVTSSLLLILGAAIKSAFDFWFGG